MKTANRMMRNHLIRRRFLPPEDFAAGGDLAPEWVSPEMRVGKCLPPADFVFFPGGAVSFLPQNRQNFEP